MPPEAAGALIGSLITGFLTLGGSIVVVWLKNRSDERTVTQNVQTADAQFNRTELREIVKIVIEERDKERARSAALEARCAALEESHDRVRGVALEWEARFDAERDVRRRSQQRERSRRRGMARYRRAAEYWRSLARMPRARD